ncbi:MAG: glyoxalase [Deltaproteobacteria bacterium]|nr:glyoxalase [Deltaproteobacteria bacterium]
MSEQKTPIQVKKIGHVVFNVSDVEQTTKFWTEIMGFHVSDRNERGMVFLRNASDHHTIALAPAREKELPRAGHVGFSHCALEVESVAKLFEIREFLRAKGVKIKYEGRKGPGCNTGVEFLDPDGFTIELYAAMDQIGWDGKSRPADEWRRAKTLEEAVENPVPGVQY